MATSVYALTKTLTACVKFTILHKINPNGQYLQMETRNLIYFIFLTKLYRNHKNFSNWNVINLNFILLYFSGEKKFLLRNFNQKVCRIQTTFKTSLWVASLSKASSELISKKVVFHKNVRERKYFLLIFIARNARGMIEMKLHPSYNWKLRQFTT